MTTFPDAPQPTPAQRRALEKLEACGQGAWILNTASYPTRAVLCREHWITSTEGQITRRGRWIIGRPDPRDRDEWIELHPEVGQP